MNFEKKVKDDLEAKSNLYLFLKSTIILLFITAGGVLTFSGVRTRGIFIFLGSRLLPIGIVSLIFFLAISLGQILITPFKTCFFRKRFSFYIGTLLSLGVFSHIMLFLGIFKLFDKKLIFILILLTTLLLIKSERKVLRELKGYIGILFRKSFEFKDIILWGAVLLIVSLYFVNSLAPSANYDVLEYHLGALKHFVSTKDISPVPNNFYSALPFHIEMLYFLGAFLEGYLGGLTPKIIVFFIFILACIGVYLLLECAGFSLRWRLFGILFFSLNQTILRLGFDAFNDLGVTLYLTSLFISTILWLRMRSSRLIILMGIFLGLMLSCKYTVWGMYVVPFFVILLPFCFLEEKISSLKNNEEGKINLKEKRASRLSFFVRTYLILIFVALLTYSPWLLKGLIMCKNPVYPFFNKIFKSPSWTETQNEFLFRAHGKVEFLSTDHFSNCLNRINGLGAIYLLPLLGIFLINLSDVHLLRIRNKQRLQDDKGGGRKRNFIIIGMTLFVFASYFIWNLITNAPDRFLAPVIPVAILLQCVLLRYIFVKHNFGRDLITIVYILFFIGAFSLSISKSLIIGLPQASLGAISGEKFLSENMNEEFIKAINFVNEKVPENGKILLIYEARQYLFDPPVVFNTVFDQSPILNIAKKVNSAEEILETLKSQGFTHIFVNELELSRFISFYTPPEEKIKRGIKDLIDNYPLERIKFIEYYGSYQIDSDFSKNREKIENFIKIINKKIVFNVVHPSGLRVYVVDLRDYLL